MLVQIALITSADLPGLLVRELGKDNVMKNSYWLFGTRLSVLADQANSGGRTWADFTVPLISKQRKEEQWQVFNLD